LAGALALVVALAGCGSSASGTDADPATVVPVAAPLYVSVAIQPPGGRKGDEETAARKLTHLSEPYGRLAEALLSGEGATPRFKRDIQPWAGERAGIFFTSLDAGRLPAGSASAQGLLEGSLAGGLSTLGTSAFADGGAQGAIVLDTKDVARARAFLDSWAGRNQASQARYRGVAYRISPKGLAAGIVKRFAVIGSESGFKGVIDASLGAGALTGATDYAKPAKRAIATVRLVPSQLNRAVRGGGAASQGVALLDSLFAGAQTASAAVSATANSLSVEGQARYASASAQSSPSFAGGGHALAALPGQSWLAAGVGNAGASANQALGLLRAASTLGAGSVFSSIGGAGIERLLAQLGSPSAKLRAIFGSWAGPAGLFVSGTGLFNLQAALTIASSEPAASKAAVGKLAALLRRDGAAVGSASIPGTDAAVTVKLTGFPAVLFIADGQNKMVIGLGQASVEGALSPTSTLSSSPSYQAAQQVLGGLEPSLILEWPALVGFLEGIGLTQSPPLSSAVSYLRSLGTLTAGSSSTGAITHFRAVLGLS
jgi:hypothetical protein